ncbi:MAG: hypothetical protein R6X02_27015 [Enhygromyxa sp.]
MADHGHHDPGGHELEAINTKLLFRLLISLSAVTLLAVIAVIQWFYSQRRELETQYAAEGSFMLTEYKTRMSADLEGIDRVAQNMVANPAQLQAPPPPSGWIHPDDLVGGGAAPADAPEGAEQDHGEDDHAGHDHGAAPAEDDAADDADAADAADDADAAADADAADDADKPVEVPAEKPAAEKPAAEKPAADED